MKGSIVKNELHDQIKELEQEYDIDFSNTQKVLLSIRGTITGILDVIYGNVSVFTLKQSSQNVDSEKAELLNVDKDEEIHVREVLIHGKGRPLIYNLSHIPLERCRKEARDDIIKGELTISKILEKHKIESRREVKKVYIEKPNATLKELFHTQEDFISREYVIFEHGEIILWIKESFPISYFTDKL